MRPPVLLLFGVGSGAFIPLPLILLWPFLGIAWLTLLLCRLLVPAGRPLQAWLTMVRKAFGAFNALVGLRVDVQAKDGPGINIWII